MLGQERKLSVNAVANLILSLLAVMLISCGFTLVSSVTTIEPVRRERSPKDTVPACCLVGHPMAR